MKVLVVAPHPDDESIGCGGTLRLHVERGDRVDVVFLTSGELGLEELAPDAARKVREGEAEQAAAVLGLERLTFLRHPDWFLGDAGDAVQRDLVRLIEEYVPDRVLSPHAGEAHPDHAAAARIVERVGEQLGRPFERAAYEVWTPMTDFDDVEDTSRVHATKLAAVRTYASQLTKFRYDDAVDGLNRFRGALAGHCDHAEVFQLPET
jgi:LmbE family N-acetylglucosaminyl deacetylase